MLIRDKSIGFDPSFQLLKSLQVTKSHLKTGKKPAPDEPMDEKEADSAPQEKEEKEARVHSSLCVVAAQERKAVDVASQEEEADADVASRERKEKQE